MGSWKGDFDVLRIKALYIRSRARVERHSRFVGRFENILAFLNCANIFLLPPCYNSQHQRHYLPTNRKPQYGHQVTVICIRCRIRIKIRNVNLPLSYNSWRVQRSKSTAAESFTKYACPVIFEEKPHIFCFHIKGLKNVILTNE